MNITHLVQTKRLRFPMSNCFIDFKLTKILLGSHIASQDIHLVCTTQGISNPLLSEQEAKGNQYVFDVFFSLQFLNASVYRILQNSIFS